MFPKHLEFRDVFKNEIDFQNFWTGRLRHLGFVVRITSKNTRGKRQDNAMPDVFIRHSDWERGRWIAFESKNPNGWKYSSDEQEVAARNREFVVVESWLQVADALGLPIETQDSLNI